MDTPITVFLSEHDTTTTAEIQAVIDGEQDAIDLIGVTPDGTEVTVRVRLSGPTDD